MTWLLLEACTVLAYAGTLLFGGVAYPMLKSLRMVGPGAAIIVGSVAGPSTLILASIIDGLIEHPGRTIHIEGDTDALFLTGMVGMLVGMTMWLIGRTGSKGTPAIPSVPR